MKLFGIVLNALLAVGFVVYLIADYDWGVIVGGIILFVLLYILHTGICDTPLKSTETYETWREILPTEKRSKLLRWASIATIVYTYVIFALLFDWLLGVNMEADSPGSSILLADDISISVCKRFKTQECKRVCDRDREAATQI